VCVCGGGVVGLGSRLEGVDAHMCFVEQTARGGGVADCLLFAFQTAPCTVQVETSVPPGTIAKLSSGIK